MLKQLLFLVVFFNAQYVFAQNTTGAGNGLSIENNAYTLGGTLTKPTLINGNYKAFRLTDIDTFYIGGRYIQVMNSTKKTLISSYDSLMLQSFKNVFIGSPNVTLDGAVKLTGYKNTISLDSVLTVDNCGNLKMVSQSSLQTIAKN